MYEVTSVLEDRNRNKNRNGVYYFKVYAELLYTITRYRT